MEAPHNLLKPSLLLGCSALHFVRYYMVSQDVLSQVSVFLVPCWYVVVSGMLSDQQAFCLTVVQNSFLCTARTLNRLVSGALWMCHSGRVSRQFPVYSSRNLDGSLKAGFLVQTKPIPSLQRLRFRQPRNPERLLFSFRAPREMCMLERVKWRERPTCRGKTVERIIVAVW